jgi:hypothetical protein
MNIKQTQQQELEDLKHEIELTKLKLELEQLIMKLPPDIQWHKCED